MWVEIAFPAALPRSGSGAAAASRPCRPLPRALFLPHPGAGLQSQETTSVQLEGAVHLAAPRCRQPFFSYPPDVASLRTTIALFLKLCKMKLDDGINLKEKTMTPCIWATSVPAEHLVPSPETFKLQTRMLLQKLLLLNA